MLYQRLGSLSFPLSLSLFFLYLSSLFFITCLCANGVPTYIYIYTYVQVCMHICTEARIALERLFEHSLNYSLRQAFS